MNDEQQTLPADLPQQPSAAEAAAETDAGEVAETEAETAPESGPDPEPDAEPESEEMLTRAEVDRLVDAAEERGYLRGRNEQIKLMGRPTPLLHNPLLEAEHPSADAPATDPTATFLKTIKPGVWD